MKWLLKFSILTLIHLSVFGQTPEKMSYQAVIRDDSDALVKSSSVDLKIILRQGSPKGSSVYEETHHAMTNKNGLLSLEIGSGTIEKGFFSEINWSQGPFFIESLVDPDGNSNYKINGISQMLSVPYALHAKSADSFTGTISPSQMPDFYTAEEVDRILEEINIVEGITQSLELNKKSLAISGGNKVSFDNWDTNAADDFSGIYDDLQNKPELYDKTEIDNLIDGIETNGGVSQNLNLDQTTLSISGGNSISFENWDTNAADDFSGIYDDLQNKPELFSGEYNSLTNVPDLYTVEEVDNLIAGIETNGGVSQNLNLDQTILSISGGNSISFENWDTNAADDFSGIYDDLQNKPEIYDRTEIDNLIDGIETTGEAPQDLSLEASTLSISGGNSISFENWDTNAADDFSGIYDDLKNKPALYDKTEIDNLIDGIETTGGAPQDLTLEGATLAISGGNSISFENWDTNAADDFSGIYDDLQNKPEIYDRTEIDNLIGGIETTAGSPQDLNLEGSTLSISSGNSISFENWDTNAADDFDGEYSSLSGAPKVYTQDEVDTIKAEILKDVEDNYVKKAEIISFTSSRNINNNDIGNTIACIYSSTLTITSGFSAMQVGDVINLEVHGTTLTVNGSSGVVINGNSGGFSSIGNDEVYTGGIIRKTGNNSYIIL